MVVKQSLQRCLSRKEFISASPPFVLWKAFAVRVFYLGAERSVLRVLTVKWVSHVHEVKAAGLLPRSRLVRVVYLQSLWALYHCRAGGCRKRLLNSWRLHGGAGCGAEGGCGML